MNSVYQVFKDSVRQFTNNTFIHIPAVATKAYQNNAVDLTYGNAFLQIEHLQRSYSVAGYGVGPPCGIVTWKIESISFCIWLALNGLGASVVSNK